MSLIYKCDMCGKDSTMTKVTFTDHPMVMLRQNIDGRYMRVYLEVAIEDDDDYHTIDSTLRGMSMEGRLTTQSDIANAIQTMPLKNRNPLICDMCKKELAQEILTKARFPLQVVDDADYQTKPKTVDMIDLDTASDELISSLFNSAKGSYGEDVIETLLKALRDEEFEEDEDEDDGEGEDD